MTNEQSDNKLRDYMNLATQILRAKKYYVNSYWLVSSKKSTKLSQGEEESYEEFIFDKMKNILPGNSRHEYIDKIHSVELIKNFNYTKEIDKEYIENLINSKRIHSIVSSGIILTENKMQNLDNFNFIDLYNSYAQHLISDIFNEDYFNDDIVLNLNLIKNSASAYIGGDAFRRNELGKRNLSLDIIKAEEWLEEMGKLGFEVPKKPTIDKEIEKQWNLKYSDS